MFRGAPSIFSIWKKISQQQIEFEQVYDVIAFRVLVVQLANVQKFLDMFTPFGIHSWAFRTSLQCRNPTSTNLYTPV